MSERERVRVAVLVAVFSLLMGAGGGIAASQGRSLLDVVGLVLIAFAVTGLVQALAIGFGFLTPRATRDGKDRDAGLQ